MILDTKTVLLDGRIIQRVIWHIAPAAGNKTHGLKYRLYCGKGGNAIVRYDNETGKGDHRHIGPDEREEPYQFISLAKLLEDFAKDIEQFSGAIE